jgi:heterodisulfide reductase subunit B
MLPLLIEKERSKMKRIAYYQGCSLEGLAVEYDMSTRAVCSALDIELVEIPDWNCCGSTPAHSYDPVLSAAMSGRNLAIAAQQGLDAVMTPCPGCLKSLKGALEVYHDENQRSAFLEVLGMPFDGKIKAISALQLLYEDVGVEALNRKVVRPLKGLTAAPYYGCLISRPPKFAQFDDPENPVSMDRLMQAIGVTVPDFPYKTECCGATFGVTRNEILAKLSGRILDMALQVGARAVVVACPLCQQNLDLRQPQINRRRNREFNIPVLYFTQLIGLALGLDPKALGIDKLFVDPADIIRELTVEAPDEELPPAAAAAN